MKAYESFVHYKDQQLQNVPSNTYERELASDIFDLLSDTSVKITEPIAIYDNTETDADELIRQKIEEWEAQGKKATVRNRIFWVYDYGDGFVYTQFLDAKILIHNIPEEEFKSGVR